MIGDLFPNERYSWILSLVVKKKNIQVWWRYDDMWMFYDPEADVAFEFDTLFNCYRPWLSLVSGKPVGIDRLLRCEFEFLGLFN